LIPSGYLRLLPNSRGRRRSLGFASHTAEGGKLDKREWIF
jgi:hypothetical protein